MLHDVGYIKMQYQLLAEGVDAIIVKPIWFKLKTRVRIPKRRTL